MEPKLREYPGLLERVIAVLKSRFAEVCGATTTIVSCPALLLSSLRALSASLGVSQVADSKVQSFASDLLVSDYLRVSSDAEKVLRFVQVGGVALLIHTLLCPLYSNARCADLPYRGSAAAAGGQSAAAGCATGASLTRLQ